MFIEVRYHNEQRKPGMFHPTTRQDKELTGSTNTSSDQGNADYTGIQFTREEEQRLLDQWVIGKDRKYNPGDYFAPELSQIKPDDLIRQTQIAVDGFDLQPLLFSNMPPKRDIPKELPSEGFTRNEQLEIEMLDQPIVIAAHGRKSIRLQTFQKKYLQEYFEDGLAKNVVQAKNLEETIVKKEDVLHPMDITDVVRRLQAIMHKADLSTKHEFDELAKVHERVSERAEALEYLRTGNTDPAIIQLLREQLMGFISEYSVYLEGKRPDDADLFWRRDLTQRITSVQERARIEFARLYELSPDHARRMRQGTLSELRARRDLFGN